MSSRSFNRLSGGAAALAVLLLVMPVVTRAQAQTASKLPAHFTATAANLNSDEPALMSRVVQITITRWTTDGQRDRLLAALKEHGEDALLKMLQEQPTVGTIRTPDSLAYDLRYAREQPWGDGGHQIFLATDRPIGFWEAANRPRTINYPFTLIEMRMKPGGTGEGKMSIATKVSIVGSTLVLENWDTTPVMLTSIRRTG